MSQRVELEKELLELNACIKIADKCLKKSKHIRLNNNQNTLKLLSTLGELSRTIIICSENYVRPIELTRLEIAGKHDEIIEMIDNYINSNHLGLETFIEGHEAIKSIHNNCKLRNEDLANFIENYETTIDLINRKLSNIQNLKLAKLKRSS